MLRMMAPDAPLLALAYVSLILAAAGESLVPLLYGLVIDAIAISPNPDDFRKYILYLIGTAFATGIFTGLRGSTFIVLGGRFGKRLRVHLFRALLRQVNAAQGGIGKARKDSGGLRRIREESHLPSARAASSGAGLLHHCF